MADRLEVYEAKRDFDRTPEPRGRTAAAPSDRPRFVVQKHAATRLHYDLRLEHEGVFLSWAVTRGPSLDPADKRLAVETEPHPLDYGDFEGTIPKGEYGGGTVMLWDRGWWSLAKGESVAAALKKGHLSIRFEGERMKGGWTLTRIAHDKSRSKRTNWLLIKHDDETARAGDGDVLIETHELSVASGRSLEAIAEGRGREPRPFMTTKAKPRRTARAASSIPAFVEPQLAKLVDRPPSGAGWVHEIKFDGYRTQLRVEGGRATLRTRKGLDWTARFPEIAREAQGLPDCLLDGEITALDAAGFPDFAGLQTALSDKTTGGLVFFLFDALAAGGEDLRDRPLSARKAALQALLDDAARPRLRYVEHFDSAGAAVLESACRMDLEGIVSKRLDAPYRSGRSESWTKAKCRGGQEVVIGGWATNGGAFRSLLVGVRREGRLVYVGRVGTGFGRAVTERLLPRLEAVEADAAPFDAGAPRKSAEIRWTRPDLVAEVEFAGWTADGRLRQASFKGLRGDKPAAEVRAETATAPPAPKGPPEVLRVRVSNPDKPLWPAVGGEPPVTKLDLARYFETVADRLLPYVRGRPCSLVRTPDGIEGTHIFQRHGGAGVSALFTQVEYEGRKPYLQIDTPEALVAAAQSGATELHPWNCVAGDPTLPGRLVFDLDPDETVGFDKVVAAALEIRERVEALGLTAWLKTTGGKGLHVVTPFKQPKRDPVAWPEAKAFAKAVCEAVAADSPGAYTTTLSKKARPGRIFLDYLRNDRLATAVSLLSPRARPGAPVSFALPWTAARADLDPRAFTLRTVPALLAEGDPWAGYEADARPLKPAIRKLAGGRR